MGEVLRGYVIKRTLLTVPVLFFVGTIVFLIVQLTPGDPSVLLLSASESAQQTAQDREKIRAHLGLDRPLYEQYGKFLWHSIQGDLGTSVFTGQSVASMFAQRFQATVLLGLLSQASAIIIAIPLGMFAAWKVNTFWDRGIMMYVVMGFSIPQYWLAYNLIFFFAVYLEWLPAVGYAPLSEGFFNWAKHLILPVLTLALTAGALTARITRSTMLEILREDYIRTARSKGLTERTLLMRHALKNAAIPILTVASLGLATVISGLAIIEVVFAIPGMGRALVEAIVQRDYPVIQGLIMVTATTFVVLNLLTDLLYAYLDPRIRYS